MAEDESEFLKLPGKHKIIIYRPTDRCLYFTLVLYDMTLAVVA